MGSSAGLHVPKQCDAFNENTTTECSLLFNLTDLIAYAANFRFPPLGTTAAPATRVREGPDPDLRPRGSPRTLDQNDGTPAVASDAAGPSLP